MLATQPLSMLKQGVVRERQQPWEQAYVMQEHHSEGNEASHGLGLRSVLNIEGREGSPHSAALSFLFLLQLPNQFFIHDASRGPEARGPGFWNTGCFFPKHAQQDTLP